MEFYNYIHWKCVGISGFLAISTDALDKYFKDAKMGDTHKYFKYPDIQRPDIFYLYFLHFAL